MKYNPLPQFNKIGKYSQIFQNGALAGSYASLKNSSITQRNFDQQKTMSSAIRYPNNIGQKDRCKYISRLESIARDVKDPDRKFHELSSKVQKLDQRLRKNQQKMNNLVQLIDLKDLKFDGSKIKFQTLDHQSNDTEKQKNLSNNIQQLKKELASPILSLQSQFARIQTNVQSIISSVRQNLTTQLLDLIQNMQKHNKRQWQSQQAKLIEIIKKSQFNIKLNTSKLNQIKIQIKNINKNYKKIQDSINLSSISSKQCNKKTLILKYSENIQFELQNQKINESNTLKIKETIYKIDKEGYLLDQNNYYLLGCNGQQIQLDNEQLLALKNSGIFDSY